MKILYQQIIKVPADGRVVKIKLGQIPEGTVFVKINNTDQYQEPDVVDIKGTEAWIKFFASCWGKSLNISIISSEAPVIHAKVENVTKTKTSGAGKTEILSISIGDQSAIRALDLIEEKQYSIYTGSGFGGILSLCLACGASISDLKEHLKENGHYITKRGITRGLREALKITDSRNQFGHLDRFLKELIPGIETLKVNDLKGDLFFSLLNISKNLSGEISKEMSGELPVLSAARCIISTFIDYEPLELKEENVNLSGALSKPGLILSAPAFGRICPDEELAIKYNFNNLRFNSFLSPVSASDLSTAQLKNHTEPLAYSKLYEASYSHDASRTIQIMRQLPGIEYNYTLLPEHSWNMRMSKKEIAGTLNNSKLLGA